MLVTPTAVTAFGNNYGFGVGNIGNNSAGFGILNKGSHRNAYYKISSTFAGATGSAAVLTRFGSIFAFITKVG